MAASPVTPWFVSDKRTSSAQWLGAAARILEDSASTELNHILYAEYSFWQFTEVFPATAYIYMDTTAAGVDATVQTITLSNSIGATGSTVMVSLGSYSDLREAVAPQFRCYINTGSATIYSCYVTARYSTPIGGKQVSSVTMLGDSVIDLTSDTITADALAAGSTAHTASGMRVTGTANIATDYISDSGSLNTHAPGTANYTYRWWKWASGKMEYWFSDYFNSFTGSQWGNMYYAAKTIYFPSSSSSGVTTGPAFIDVPKIEMQVRDNGGNTSNAYGASATSEAAAQTNFHLFAKASSFPRTWIDVHLTGRWQ